jgi:hypothetical protein
MAFNDSALGVTWYHFWCLLLLKQSCANLDLRPSNVALHPPFNGRRSRPHSGRGFGGRDIGVVVRKYNLLLC